MSLNGPGPQDLLWSKRMRRGCMEKGDTDSSHTGLDTWSQIWHDQQDPPVGEDPSGPCSFSRMKAPSQETLTLRSHQLSPRSWLWAQVSLETHREILRVKASPGETASGLNVQHPRVKASLPFLSRYPPPRARTLYFEILKNQSIWLHTFSQTIKTTSKKILPLQFTAVCIQAA